MAQSRKPGGSSNEQERWSQRVTRDSNALDLAPGVFTWDDPFAIAKSLKTSAEASQRLKSTPFRSAMSMLTFYINWLRVFLKVELSAKPHERWV